MQVPEPKGHLETLCRVHLGLKLLDGEKKGHTLSSRQLHCNRCVIDAIFFLEVNIARAIHIELPRDLYVSQEIRQLFTALLQMQAIAQAAGELARMSSHTTQRHSCSLP